MSEPVILFTTDPGRREAIETLFAKARIGLVALEGEPGDVRLEPRNFDLLQLAPAVIVDGEGPAANLARAVAESRGSLLRCNAADPISCLRAASVKLDAGPARTGGSREAKQRYSFGHSARWAFAVTLILEAELLALAVLQILLTPAIAAATFSFPYFAVLVPLPGLIGLFTASKLTREAFGRRPRNALLAAVALWIPGALAFSYFVVFQYGPIPIFVEDKQASLHNVQIGGLTILLLAIQALMLWTAMRLLPRITSVGRLRGLGGVALWCLGVVAVVGVHDLLATGRAEQVGNIKHQLARTGHCLCPIYISRFADEDMALQARIREVEAANDLPVDGKPSDRLLTTLRSLPDKTQWTMAADGSGDVRNLTELEERAGLDAVVTVRPGTYRTRPSSDDDIAIAALADRDMGKPIRFTIRGTGKPGDTIFDFSSAQSIALRPGDHIENVTLRQDSGAQASLVDCSLCGATLSHVVIETSSADHPALGASAADNGKMLIEHSRIRNRLGTAIAIGPGDVNVQDNRIEGGAGGSVVSVISASPIVENNVFRARDTNCLFAGQAGRPRLINNDFRRCTADFYPVWADSDAQLWMKGNKGITRRNVLLKEKAGLTADF